MEHTLLTIAIAFTTLSLYAAYADVRVGTFHQIPLRQLDKHRRNTELSKLALLPVSALGNLIGRLIAGAETAAALSMLLGITIGFMLFVLLVLYPPKPPRNKFVLWLITPSPDKEE